MILHPTAVINPQPPDDNVAGPLAPLQYNNNNVHGSILNNNNNNNIYTSHRRFASSSSSPALADSSNTISFASLNVRGINSPTKFDAILDDLREQNFSIIGLQETKLSELIATAMFKQYCACIQNTFIYRVYWSFDPTDRAGEVSLLILLTFHVTFKKYTVMAANLLLLTCSYQDKS